MLKGQAPKPIIELFDEVDKDITSMLFDDPKKEERLRGNTVELVTGNLSRRGPGLALLGSDSSSYTLFYPTETAYSALRGGDRSRAELSQFFMKNMASARLLDNALETEKPKRNGDGKKFKRDESSLKKIMSHEDTYASFLDDLSALGFCGLMAYMIRNGNCQNRERISFIDEVATWVFYGADGDFNQMRNYKGLNQFLPFERENIIARAMGKVQTEPSPNGNHRVQQNFLEMITTIDADRLVYHLPEVGKERLMPLIYGR